MFYLNGRNLTSNLCFCRAVILMIYIVYQCFVRAAVAQSVYWLGYRLNDWVPFGVGVGIFSPRHRVQTGTGAHPTTYPMGNEGSFLDGKAAVAWLWPFTSI